MLPSGFVTTLHDAITRAQAWLLAHQAPDGHWVGELEANTTITSEYLLLCHLIDRVDRKKEAKAVRYLRRRQLPDGSFNLFEDGPANLSATIKAYFAMKLAGVRPADSAMVAARERIREMGGPVKADVFTKILLALFGEYDWNGVPAMPVEIMLLPRPFFLFNIYEVSYWSRTVIVPLLIIMDRKPVKWLPPHLALDELWPDSREKTSLRFPRVPEPFTWRKLFWKNFFIAVDDGLKIWERFTKRPLRKRAIEAARAWLEERLAVPGGLGGIYPAMANSILAMRLLGYPDDHPLVSGQIKEIEALAVEDDDEIHYQPCPSPVWDTALTVNALIATGRCSCRAIGRSNGRTSSPAAGRSSTATTSIPTSTTPGWFSWRSRRSGWTATPRRPRRSSASAGSSACRARTGAGRRSTPTTTVST